MYDLPAANEVDETSAKSDCNNKVELDIKLATLISKLVSKSTKLIDVT